MASKPQLDPVPPCPTSAAKPQPPSLLSRWGKRAGLLAFLFFFVKGLAWLVVPVALAAWWSQ